jgi:hypothetical protein
VRFLHFHPVNESLILTDESLSDYVSNFVSTLLLMSILHVTPRNYSLALLTSTVHGTH